MKILELVFKTEQHKVRSLKFNYANQNLTDNEVRGLMKRISDLDMFEKDGVKLYATPVGARYLDRQNYSIFDDTQKTA